MPILRYGTQANAVVSGTTITVSFFGEVSSTGQIVGEPRTEVSADQLQYMLSVPLEHFSVLSLMKAVVVIDWHVITWHGAVQLLQVWEEDESDGLNTCERCVREIVATLDGNKLLTIGFLIANADVLK